MLSAVRIFAAAFCRLCLAQPMLKAASLMVVESMAEGARPESVRKTTWIV